MVLPCSISFLFQSELALGRFPYPQWDTEFEMLAVVVDGDAPRLSLESGFSKDFMDLVHQW